MVEAPPHPNSHDMARKINMDTITNASIRKTMPIDISPILRRWLHDHGLAGYIRVVEAPTHPNTHDMAEKINIETITNASIRKKLGLTPTGERQFKIPP